MTANQVYIVVFALFGIGVFALAISSVKWGLRWAKIADISLLKAFGLYLLTMLVSCVIAICAFVASLFVPINFSERTLAFVGYAAQFLVPCLVFVLVYRVRPLRAALATIPFFLAGIFALFFAQHIFRAYAYEAFVIPTNSMAPTLLGEHWEAPCPDCGEPAYGSPPDAWGPSRLEDMPLICSKEMKTVHVKNTPQLRGGGDRLAACKLLQPRRWDILIFRLPSDPTINYAKRVVGLPGEKLEIRDGSVWINGARLEPPAAIRGIHYSPTIESHGQVYSGPGSVPVELGPDEYFVLGDFVDCAADSRMWERGAPGHPPYAVPASYIVGVAINIYWPPSRWTGFR